MLKICEYSQAQWPDVEPVWRMLAAASPEASFFLSAEWTRTWLAVFGDSVHATALVFRADDRPVAAALIVQRRVRRAVLPIRQVFLNACGEDTADETCIEFNDILCLPEWKAGVAEELIARLNRLDWHELVLAGFVDGPMLRAITQAAVWPVETTQRTSNYVDLAALRASGQPYVSVLRSRTRTYVRENVRIYREAGDLCVEQPGSVRDALAWLDELADLHQQSWTGRGQPGVFASKRFFAFHRMLIESAFDTGNILMLRVSAGTGTIGILYNFVWRGKVLFYQSGFKYEPERRTKPGLLTFALAVQYCAGRGYSEFDFLAGGEHYKRDLSTASRDLFWTKILRPGVVNQTLKLISRSKEAITGSRLVPAVAGLLVSACATGAA